VAGPTDDESGPQAPYAFGDTAVASRRLEVLASVFGPTSRRLLADLAGSRRRVVLDLGCGPGHTTAMLAGAFPEAEVIGIDASDAFVAEASGRVTPRCSYRVADVTESPLPGAPADMIYARFLVVHLPDPPAALATWAGQLAPGGVLVVEEPERIDTGDADFRRYLELASVVVRSRGGDLYAGGRLADAAPPTSPVMLERCTPLEVPAGKAATIFSLNLATWGDDPAVSVVSAPEEIAGLARRLEHRVGDVSTGVIRWWMRQLVVGPEGGC
jgi:trans-aconitate 2-methyltransferase